MKEIGNLLRKAREEKGISLDDISKETKIQKKYLNSLEEGDFSLFPGRVYVKGALRNYAEAVGLDPAEFISLYEESVKPKKVSEEKNQSKEVKDKKTSPVIGKEKKPLLPVSALVWIILLAIIASGSIWYRYHQVYKGEVKIPYSGEKYVDEEENDEKPVDSKVLPVDEPQNTKKLTKISGDNLEISFLLSGVEQKEIILTFTGNCWTRIEQDGRLVEEKTYRSGDYKNLGDSTETRLRLGYPPAAMLKVNGFEVTDLNHLTNPINIIIRKER
ncbi:MAG: helix-turn-helix domain-containing protein [Dethiobacter sp.]|nr:MAG: helix-turn-helix domain-containing protein [Dethiobacter sp.]